MVSLYKHMLCGTLLAGLWGCGSQAFEVEEAGPSAPLVRRPPIQPPLHTSGRYIRDAHGQRVKLASINWYGASDERFVVGGLDVRHRDDIASRIAGLGFNSVRLPYSDEMVRDNPVVEASLLAANPDLIGMRALDVFAATVRALTRQRIMVIINDHITQATWCCGANLCDTAWYNTGVPFCRIPQSEGQWIDRWETMMAQFINEPFVVGADLRNEVRGVFLPWRRWVHAAERAGNRLLAMNPNWIIVVEGYHSGDDLTHVRHRPVVLDVPNRVVYSAHIYSWFGWGALKTYGRRTYASFAAAMQRNWAYLVDGNVAPVWIGEMGTPEHPAEHDINYWNNTIRFLDELDVDFAYWALNPRKPHGNAPESYSFIRDNWTAKEGDYRLRDLQSLMP